MIESFGAGRTVVVGVDGTEPSMAALQKTASVVKAVDGRIVAVFIRHTPPIAASIDSGLELPALEETLDELENETRDNVAELLGESGVTWELVVREGDPGHELTEVAHERNAVCVVVGAPVHGAVASVVFTSVASYLLHHCDVSVLIVRPDRTS